MPMIAPPIHIHTARGSMMTRTFTAPPASGGVSNDRYTSSTRVVRTDGVPITSERLGNWRSDGAYCLPLSTTMWAATLV